MLSETATDAARHGDICRRIECVYELPPMPEMARRVLELRHNPDADISDLAAIVELDPSLAAQVVRYATSPLHGYRGRIDSIQDAITRVLGFDLVMNMALGLATGRSFRNPVDGPLGLHSFWRHAVYSAALAQAIVRRMPRELRPEPGMAYLAGLLHNFGFLLLGHLFPPEFKLLNKLAAAQPDASVTALERCVLGMGQARDAFELGHARLGGWLMRSWELPAEIQITVCEHHNPDYAGEHAVYSHLVLLTDHLLKRHDIGDAPDGELPTASLTRIGVEPDVLEALTASLIEQGGELDGMAGTLAGT
ncbi:hypothetical protein TspCOW1_33540 [Thiohalobacter sp. COW1]|uniref:HDOD domain-containing protein n=1 Tax=Thiohalobacter sp. COW1 TaxID=2795687 RepID=UPI0019154D20|nr:HDOD domain-containing protein [Thiohalobacter sp. COW1]BCO33251.1 hypothetical protein TspCOW1_33540 [Thiohalobacter sp. COW1]